MSIKKTIIKKPLIGPFILWVKRKLGNSQKAFDSSESYWKNRYEAGGNSGSGSYNQLADFKAEVLNAFVSEYDIKSVIEYGCGDGNQLTLAQYPSYTGFDVSSEALALCLKKFSKDKSKSFKLMSEYSNETAELTLS